MNEQERELVLRLLSDRIRWLIGQVHTQDLLSRPVEPGHWRWADVKPGGYGKKSPEELEADQERAARERDKYREELAVAESAFQKVNNHA